MGHDDTPPEQIPVRSDVGPTDAVWLREWRRDLSATLRDIRQETAIALRDVAARLNGIDGRLAQGNATLDKHGDQIAELAAADAEHHARIEKLERDGSSGLVRRVTAVEGTLAPIAKDFAEQQAMARAAEHSLGKRIIDGAISGAGQAIGPIIIGFLAWLVLTYARGLPVGSPVQAGAQAEKGAP